jgi:Tol biopolymer transport system component
MIDIDGSHLINLTNDTSDTFKYGWSLNGDRLVYASRRTGKSQLYMVKLDGGGFVRLTNNPARDTAPVWQSGP